LLNNIYKISSMILLQTVFSSTICYANSDSIQGTSIKYNDTAAITPLLASIPEWQPETITQLFDAYRHPERFQIPKSTNSNMQSALFINAFFGPLDNPFTKYPRPAKVFVIFKTAKNSTSTFETAPIIHDAVNGNYYVFDADETSPILLDDWIVKLKKNHAEQSNFVFNICNGYGSKPIDSCANSAYQDEGATTGYSISKDYPSAIRDKQESWLQKTAMISKGSDSIYNNSVLWSDESNKKTLLNTIQSWPNHKAIQDAFEKIRDLRYFQDAKIPDFKRRITWLFPDDGCWTRAAAIIKDFFGPMNNNLTNTLPRPSKLFAFGDLCVNTTNAPRGYVSWWYHTAPIVKDAETNIDYVLDPSVDSQTALTLDEWMSRVASNTEKCAGMRNKVSQFSICNGYGASPYDSCNNPEKVDFASEAYVMRSQHSYRHAERERQAELGRDVEKVLGDLPPWLTS
jgi:hypothetical protein